MKLIWLLVTLVPGLLGYRHFEETIPNGSRVPHPCKTNYVWHGVGHKNKAGGGERNAFGLDFARNGKKWDKCLCAKDSDGDGKTNGEELGDPDCVWTPGETPKITTLSKISHPGICDPYDSEKCKNQNNWEFCENAEFKCDAMKDPDVKNFTVQMTKTKIPAQETTYMCQIIPGIPNDAEYHAIATTPVIDNVNVMHHMRVFMCTDEEVTSHAGAFDKPAPCGMSTRMCAAGLGGWTVGMEGVCFHNMSGIRMGKSKGFTSVMIEFHWNNPELKADYEDGSGYTVYYTPKLRQYDSQGILQVPMVISIPPKQLHHEVTSVCSAECGRKYLNGSTRYITMILPHMHYMGRAAIVEHWRGKTKLPDLLNMKDYSYDTPIMKSFATPVEYRPGDKLINRCFYNSMQSDKWIFWGDGTQDEMCRTNIVFYGGPSFACRGSASTTFCTTPEEAAAAGGATCDVQSYMTTTFKSHMQALAGACNATGLTCKPGCEAALAQVQTHTCMQGDYKYMVIRLAERNKVWGRQFLNLWHSCTKFEIQVQAKNGQHGSSEHGETEGGLCSYDNPSKASAVFHGNVMMALIVVLMILLMK